MPYVTITIVGKSTVAVEGEVYTPDSKPRSQEVTKETLAYLEKLEESGFLKLSSIVGGKEPVEVEKAKLVSEYEPSLTVESVPEYEPSLTVESVPKKPRKKKE